MSTNRFADNQYYAIRLSLITLMLSCVCFLSCARTMDNSAVSVQLQNGSPMQNPVEIRKFIISSIISDYLSVLPPQKVIVIRLLRGEAFEISDLSSTQKEKVKIEFGIRRIPIKAGNNDMKNLHEDSLDYSPAYIYSHNVICIQIEDFTIPEKHEFLCVYAGIFRSALDACGYTYVFRKTDSGWLFQKRIRTWQS